MPEQPTERPKSSLSWPWKIMFMLAPLAFIVGGTLLLTPVADKEVQDVEMHYGIEVVEAPSTVLNREITIELRDDTQIKCQMPTKSAIKRGESMQCKDRQIEQRKTIG